MMNSTDLLATRLKERGYSTTTTRKRVFLALENSKPLAMRELIAALDGDVDRASIYRTIALFEELGIAQRIQIGWKYKLELSNSFQSHHHHLTCLRCGRLTPFKESPELEAMLQRVAKEQQFLLLNHSIELQGTCVECQVIEYKS